VGHLQGDIDGHGNLVKSIKQVDVVISAIGNMQIADQTKIIAAIKEAGNVKVGPWSYFTFCFWSSYPIIFNLRTVTLKYLREG